MDTLHSLFPTAEELLAIAPDDLAPVLLRLARNRRQQGDGIFWPDSVTRETSVTGEPVRLSVSKKGGGRCAGGIGRNLMSTDPGGQIIEAVAGEAGEDVGAGGAVLLFQADIISLILCRL